jgi:hypothetical protein
MQMAKDDVSRHDYEMQAYHQGRFSGYKSETCSLSPYDYFKLENKTKIYANETFSNDVEVENKLKYLWDSSSQQDKQIYYTMHQNTQQRAAQNCKPRTPKKRGRKPKNYVDQQFYVDNAQNVLEGIMGHSNLQKSSLPLIIPSFPNIIKEDPESQSFVSVRNEEDYESVLLEDMMLSSQSSQEIQDIVQFGLKMAKEDPENVMIYSECDSEDIIHILQDDTSS